MRLTPLRPGDEHRRREGDGAAPTPAPAPEPAPGPLSAAVIAPPFIVLAVAGAAAALLGTALASGLRGEWMNLEGLGYAAAGGGFALFSGLFLTLDARAARRLPRGLWPSRGAMWRTTLGRTGLAVVGTLPLGLLFVVVVSNLAQAHSSGTGTVIVGVTVAVAAWIARAALTNVRARRRTRIGP